ncbi:MAG TPA: hypothetical protein PLQ56_03480 [Aggregatilineales bacterium]|nr:hypothetical protein [Aggregatilineales bacterium]
MGFPRLIQRFDDLTQLAAAVLPFCPQAVPHRFGNPARSEQARHPSFFFIDRFQRCLQLLALVGSGISQLLCQFLCVTGTDKWDHARVNLYLEQFGHNLGVDVGAEKAHAASTGIPIVGCSAT